MISSYSDILTIGHKLVIDIFNGPVVVEEKVDGSQFSFQMIQSLQPGTDDSRTYLMRSKGQDQTHQLDGMFSQAHTTVEGLNLIPGWIYRGEYLQKPHHNALTYNRVPKGHIILFDIETGPGVFLSPENKRLEADRIGLECVPCYYEGELNPADLERLLQGWLETESVLGGQKIEGVVIKNYDLFTPDHKVAMAKYVSDQFKEVHRKTWGESNPTQTDFVQALAQQYRTEARWNKAILHLREQGLIVDEPKDIGLLMREVNADVLKECKDEIKDKLFEHFWKQISRVSTAGLPEWYKNKLLGNFTDPMKSYETPSN